jgi:hypothetical protein
VLGPELVERAASRATNDAALRASLTTARARFAHRTGRVIVRCPPSGACLATIDGVAIDAARPRIVSVGTHTIATQIDGAFEPHIVDIPADGVAVVTPRGAAPPPMAAPPPPVTAAPPHEEHASNTTRVAFFATLGATVVAGGFTTWSALDTKSKHGAFADAGCDHASAPGCEALASAGRTAEIRTNTLLLATGVFAATTAALGLFAVRWGDARPDVAVGPGGAEASMRFRF